MIRILFAMLLAVSALVSPAQAGTWKSIATWDIEYAENGCFTLDQYKNNTVFGFGLTKAGEFDLIVSDPNWNLGAADQLALVQIDDGAWSKHTASTAGRTTLMISVILEEEGFQVLQGGSVIRIRLGNRTMSYALTGTKLMLPELLKCAASIRNASFL